MAKWILYVRTGRRMPRDDGGGATFRYDLETEFDVSERLKRQMEWAMVTFAWLVVNPDGVPVFGGFRVYRGQTDLMILDGSVHV